jgi:hypothetical protein
MELPSEWNSFWAVEVLPEHACRIVVPEGTDCSLTNIALDQGSDLSPGTRIILDISVNDSPPVAISCFTLGRFESASVDLKFGSGDRIALTSRGGTVSVHACGFLTGGLALEVDNGSSPPAPDLTE